jgi:uncharacterized protein (DUF2062 family)
MRISAEQHEAFALLGGPQAEGMVVGAHLLPHARLTFSYAAKQLWVEWYDRVENERD